MNKATILLALMATALFAAPTPTEARWNWSWNKEEPDTIASVASGVEALSTLVAAVSAEPTILAAASDANSVLTVFAPTNQAFTNYLAQSGITADELLDNPIMLRTVLSYHIIAGNVDSTTALSLTPAIDAVPTLLPGGNLSLTTNGTSLFVDDALVITPDVPAGKSKVHIIDHVLAPPPVPTLASVAAGAGLDLLVEAITNAPAIFEVASSPFTEVTVFAPTDDAFVNLLAALGQTKEELFANTELLTAVLAFHIIPGIVRASAATPEGVSVRTLNPGTRLIVSTDGTNVLVDDSSEGAPYAVDSVLFDVEAGISLVQVVPAVLLPPPVPTIAEVASGVDSLSILVQAVSASPLIDAVTDPSTAVTVFAPTNQAFEDALEALGMTAEQLLADEHMLTTILSYHIVPSVIASSDITSRSVGLPTLLRNAYLKARVYRSEVMINRATVIVRDVYAGNSNVHVIDEVLLPPQWYFWFTSAWKWIRNLLH